VVIDSSEGAITGRGEKFEGGERGGRGRASTKEVRKGGRRGEGGGGRSLVKNV